MKGTAAVVCVVLLVGIPLAAQTSKETTRSKITIEHGVDVKVTGCIERTENGTGFLLTKVADKHGALHSYMLVPDDGHDVAKHVGHLVEIKGKATDRGDAKVKIETRTKTEADHGEKETHGKTEMKGDLPHVPYLGVQSVKLIAGACR
jgi:hypothetical protein